jgi:tetrahydromethanopterin:alpha-L-glutamate ligase
MTKIAVIGTPGGWSSELLVDTVREKTGFGLLVNPETLALDLERGRVYTSHVELTGLDAVIIKKAGPFYSPDLLNRLEILRFLTKRGVAVFSDPYHIIRVVDRMNCTVTMRLAGVPMPPTCITEDMDRAEEFVEQYGRIILKPLFTSKARGMVLVEAGQNVREKLTAFQKAGNRILYVQQVVEHRGRDLGLAFLGGRYLATYSRNGKRDSWNTTILSGGAYLPYEPSPKTLEVAQKAQDLFGLDFTCVDVAETDDGPMVFEVSAFGGFRGLKEANSIDAAGLYVDYVLDRVSEERGKKK